MDEITLLTRERITLFKLQLFRALPKEKVFHVDELIHFGLISPNYSGQDQYLNYIEDGTVSVTDKYRRYLAARREVWFWRLLPIMISMGSLIVSAAALLLKMSEQQ